MAIQDFDYGWLHGPLVESTKDADNFQYGYLHGPVIWIAAAAPGGVTVPQGLHRIRRGMDVLGQYIVEEGG